MQRMTPLEPSGDDDSPTYPLRQIVDTAQPQREQPMEPWGNAGRSGPLARPVSHRVPRGRRTAGNRSRRHPTAWPSNLPGAWGTEHFGELADPCGRDSQAVCLFPRHIRGLSKGDATAMGSTRPRQARASRTRCHAPQSRVRSLRHWPTWPSMHSRSRSVCPQCLAYSSIRCTSNS
jgi:hypothetical protein